MQYPGIAYCRDIATEKFRARQPHVESRSFQQIQLRVVQAIRVPGVGVRSQQSLQVGGIFIAFPASVPPCGELEQSQPGCRCHLHRQICLYLDER